MESNPYLEARREWDERYADLVLGKRNWQIASQPGTLTKGRIRSRKAVPAKRVLRPTLKAGPAEGKTRRICTVSKSMDWRGGRPR
jgi:hypothetical protein